MGVRHTQQHVPKDLCQVHLRHGLSFNLQNGTEWPTKDTLTCRHAGIFERSLGQKPAMRSAQCLCHPKASTNLSMKEHWPARATLPDISMLIWPADQQRHVHKVYGSVQHLDSEASTLLANHVVQRFSRRRLTGPCNWSQSPHQTAPKRLKNHPKSYQQTVGS